MTLQTVLHTYRFDLSDADQKAEYEALTVRLKAMGLRELHMGAATRSKHTGPDMDGLAVTLETKHLFDNQWNTAPIPGYGENGLRLFDWFSDAAVTWGNSHMRAGHWLEQTDEMREIRRNTNACGYCGHQEAAQRGAVFCPKCIGSEYLTEEDLKRGATRMVPVDSGKGNWKALSEAEAAHLLPLFRHAQIHGSSERDKVRLAAARERIEAKAAAAIQNAQTERDGFIWLMDRGIKTENVLYYAHKGRFSFGWRKPYGGGELSTLLEAMGAEFRWPYDIACADGRTLSGEG